jgi:hypothetical protein
MCKKSGKRERKRGRIKSPAVVAWASATSCNCQDKWGRAAKVRVWETRFRGKWRQRERAQLSPCRRYKCLTPGWNPRHRLAAAVDVSRTR